MMNNTPEAAHRRKGIFLLLMPLILFPILFLVLYHSEPVIAETQNTGKGMNLEIPAPILANKQESKSEAYLNEKNTEDEKGPWGLPEFLLDQGDSELIGREKPGFSKDRVEYLGASEFPSRAGESRYSEKTNTDHETNLIRQLQDLEALLHKEAEDQKESNFSTTGSLPVRQDTEVKQLEDLMKMMETTKSEPDPEIQQLDQLIDKLLILQNPQLGLSEYSPQSEVISVAMADAKSEIDSIRVEETNGFFGLIRYEQPLFSGGKTFRKTVAALVSKSQEIFPGEAIEIQLDQELLLESGVVPAGTILFAQTSISGSRLQLSVSGILQNNTLIPVALKGYGLDGIPGIELGDVKGASQWLKETGNSAQGFNINSYGMDWQSQLATSGVEATRSLIRGKSKVKKLSIKSGHPFLLIDSSNSNSQQL